MREVDQKSYKAGFDRAGAEYIRQARAMVNEEVEKRVPIAYRGGYRAGVKAACEVLNLEADTNMYKSIPAPVVPELNLPYTAEECEPLPEDDESDSEEEVEDLTLSDFESDKEGAEGGKEDAEGGKEDAEREDVIPENVAEVEAGTKEVATAENQTAVPNPAPAPKETADVATDVAAL